MAIQLQGICNCREGEHELIVGSGGQGYAIPLPPEGKPLEGKGKGLNFIPFKYPYPQQGF
jgi:hypothetical protein